MRITKFEHSCFYIENEAGGLLFDPLEIERKLPDFMGLYAIIVTHQHGDHFQPEVIERIRAKNPQARIFVTEDNAFDGATVVKNGDRVNEAFNLEFYGQNHAEIIKGQVPCQNIGVVVDGVFANSGDSFDAPPVRPEILLAPVTAPWLKIEETVDFVRSIRPKMVLPTHDGLNSAFGNTVSDNWVRKGCEAVSAEYKDIHYGSVISLLPAPCYN